MHPDMPRCTQKETNVHRCANGTEMYPDVTLTDQISTKGRFHYFRPSWHEIDMEEMFTWQKVSL